MTQPHPLSIQDIGRTFVDIGLITLPTFNFQKHSNMAWKGITCDQAWNAWNDLPTDAEVTGAWTLSGSWPNDLVCLDIDVYESNSLTSALKELGLSDEGIHVETTSGGRHVYFRWPDRPRLRGELPMSSGGQVETRCSDFNTGLMLPGSRAESSKNGARAKGEYKTADLGIFLDTAAWPILGEEAQTRLRLRLAASDAAPQENAESESMGRLKSAILGTLNAQIFPLLSADQFAQGSRTKYFFSCGHAIGANAWVDGSGADLAGLFFNDIADREFVNWDDDRDGEKRKEALKQFTSGIHNGRQYSEPGKAFAVNSRLSNLGVKGIVCTTDDELVTAFRRVFNGAAHLQIQKSGVDVTGYSFFLQRGAPGFHLRSDEIHAPEVQVVQLSQKGTPRERFLEIIRKLSLGGECAESFVGSKKGFPKLVWERLYTAGSEFQTQVDWLCEIRTLATKLSKEFDENEYSRQNESLDAREGSRLWYHIAPRKVGKDETKRGIDKSVPWISGQSLRSQEHYLFIASREWWESFISDNSGVDGIYQWLNETAFSLQYRSIEVRAVPLHMLTGDSEGGCS